MPRLYSFNGVGPCVAGKVIHTLSLSLSLIFFFMWAGPGVSLSLSLPMVANLGLAIALHLGSPAGRLTAGATQAHCISYGSTPDLAPLGTSRPYMGSAGSEVNIIAAETETKHCLKVLLHGPSCRFILQGVLHRLHDRQVTIDNVT